MDNTKDLVKEHMAKLIADEIMKDSAVVEQLKAEILKDLLPAQSSKFTPAEDANTMNLDENIEQTSEPIAEQSNEEIKEQKDLTMKEKIQKILQGKSETPATEKLKPKLKGDFINKWKHFVEREQIMDNVNPISESNDFTFNPDGVPNEYKNVFKGEVKPKTFKDEPYTPASLESLDILSKVKKTVSYKPVPTINRFDEGLFKDSPIRVRIKTPEEIKEEFIKNHSMPPEVVELLEKKSATKPKNRTTRKPKNKPGKRSAKPKRTVSKRAPKMSVKKVKR